MSAVGTDSIANSIGTGPGVVVWWYREPTGVGANPSGNPFAEWAGSVNGVLYRRCFDVVQPPACRFPMAAFAQRVPKNRVLILHDPEVFADLVEVLPELAKTCLGHEARLVLVSESAEYLRAAPPRWSPFLKRCRFSAPALGNNRRIALELKFWDVVMTALLWHLFGASSARGALRPASHGWPGLRRGA